VNNTIFGNGYIGNSGSNTLTLINQSKGLIACLNDVAPLVIDTGTNAVTNTGTLEANATGELYIASPVTNSSGKLIAYGELVAAAAVTGGTATIEDAGTVEFGSASSAATTFAAGSTGELILDDGAHYTGTVSGFGTTQSIDLPNVQFATVSKSYSSGILTVKDTSGDIAKIKFSGSYWKAADEQTQQRILNAAEKYLALGHTSIEQWIGTTSLRRNDVAAFRALLLLREHNQSAYQQISAATWAKWAPVIAALPKSTESQKSKFLTEVVSDALKFAPTEFVGAIRQIMRAERARVAASTLEMPQVPGASFFVLHELDNCWNSEPLKIGIFNELRNDTNSEDQFGAILEPLLAAQFAPARVYAIDLLATVDAKQGRYSLEAAAALARHNAAEAWPTIWKLLVDHPVFGQQFFFEVCALLPFARQLFHVFE